MDIINTVFASLLTSTIVSTAVSFVLKAWFEAKLKHHFELELEKIRHSYEIEVEKLKAQLTVKAETAHEITTRRLSAYPQVVELIYRIRNLAREIVTPAKTPPVIISEFSARTSELENNLYKFRMDLERDTVFILVHTFKNTAKTFNRLLDDREHYLTAVDEKKANEIGNELLEVFSEIEKQYHPIIDKLSGIIPNDPETNSK